MAAPVSTKPGWRFGVFEVDMSRGELRRAGIPLKLRDQSFQILVALLKVPGEIVTRSELRRKLWPSDTFVDFDHSLNTAMMKLRDALGDSTDAPIYIETIPKRGYRFIAPVAATADLLNSPPTVAPINSPSQIDGTTATPTPSGPVASVRRRNILRNTAVTGSILFVAFGAFWLLRFRHVQTQPGQSLTNPRITPVTSSLGRVLTPAISRDGRQVAYAWNGPERGVHFDIYWQVIGSMDKPLRLTYLKSGWTRYPTWSPDGREIAFTWCAGGNDGVYTVPVTGGAERKLTSVTCQYNSPEPLTWFANGTRMLMIDRCSANGPFGLVVFSMETGEKKCLADFGPSGFQRRYKYSLSPDESTVAFNPSEETPDCAIYAMRLSGGTARRIVRDDHPCRDVMWTPDGASIVFASQRSTASWSLWRVPARGGTFQPEAVYPALGTYSQDGRRFLYMEAVNGDPDTVWRADLASPGGKVLSNRKLISTQFGDLDAQPSPDGTRVAWMSSRSGPAEIWVSSSTGEFPFRLTNRNGYCGSPRWSPDGKWIAFDCDTVDGTQLFVIDAEGRNERQISHGPYNNVVPSWSRDGKLIYFASNRRGRHEVWKRSLETGKESQLTTHGGFNPFESYDGRTVYFSRFDEAGIWSVPSAGGAESLVLGGKPQSMYWGHWAVTRSGLYLLNADVEPKGRIEFYDFAARSTWPVLDCEKRPHALHPSLSATADGRTVYYTLWDAQSVIKMMEFQR